MILLRLNIIILAVSSHLLCYDRLLFDTPTTLQTIIFTQYLVR